MNTYANNSTALKLVTRNNLPKPKPEQDRKTTYADIRMNLRNEAKMLVVTGKCLLIFGIVVSALLCMVNGFICHELMNATSSVYAITAFDPSTVTAFFIGMCVFSFLFAGMTAFLSLVLHGVAESLREDSKKIK